MYNNEKQKDKNDIFNIVKEFFSQEGKKLELLRIACLGNAEKTIQGELFHHLRYKYDLNVVIECGYRDVDDRHIDIMVFNNEWSPIVAIELKHYSPHQGTINPLLGGLEDDYNKLRPVDLPLIQVGLYSAIDSVLPFPLPASPLLNYYRFLMTYVLRQCLKLNTGNLNRALSTDQTLASNWATDSQQKSRYSQSTTLVRGQDETFQIDPPSGLTVKGRVNWIVMLTF